MVQLLYYRLHLGLEPGVWTRIGPAVHRGLQPCKSESSLSDRPDVSQQQWIKCLSLSTTRSVYCHQHKENIHI